MNKSTYASNKYMIKPTFSDWGIFIDKPFLWSLSMVAIPYSLHKLLTVSFLYLITYHTLHRQVIDAEIITYIMCIL